MLPAVHAAIVRAAQENGLDPSMALAIADRESGGDVNGRAPGSSAFGIFQLLRSERNTYGGNSQDPHEQATAWARYIKGTRAEMERGLGRPPTGPELYLGHYFGGTRAARLVAGQIPGQTPVAAVFSPQELAANPNIGRAGTTGALSSSIMADISRRQGKYAGAGVGSDAGDGADFDPAQWGAPVGKTPEKAPSTGAQSKAVPYTPEPTEDFSKFGAVVSQQQKPTDYSARNRQWTKPGAKDFNTDLGQEEPAFRDWVKQNNVPFNPEAGATDYDMRGFWKGLQNGDPAAKSAVNSNDKQIHFPDYWKTPSHESFSNESQWATPNAPKWNDKDQLIDSGGGVVFDEKQKNQQPVSAPMPQSMQRSEPVHYIPEQSIV